jgi:hypothetical protein
LADENTVSHALRFNKDYAWLRIKGPGEYTPAHSDWFFFNDPDQTDMFKEPPLPPSPISCHICQGVNKGSNNSLEGSSSSNSSSYTQNFCDSNIDTTNISVRQITGIEIAPPHPKNNTKVHASSGSIDGELKEGLEQCGECFKHFHPSCVPKYQLFPSPSPSTYSPCSLLLSHHDDCNFYCPECLPRPVVGTCWIPLGDMEVEQGVLGNHILITVLYSSNDIIFTNFMKIYMFLVVQISMLYYISTIDTSLHHHYHSM